MPQKVTIRYGAYEHPLGTTRYSTSEQTVFGDNRLSQLVTTRISISGNVHGKDFAECQTRFTDLVNAYSVRAPVFEILLDGAQTLFRIDAGSVIGGIRVVTPPSIPNTVGSIHHNFIPFTIELEATRPVIAAINTLKSFKETLSFSGGGPTYKLIETLYGPPVKQQTRRQTIFRARQSGTATGLYMLPSIPPPLFPDALIKGGDSERGSGERMGNIVTLYRTASWSYEYESATPLIALPNDWGTVL